MSGRLDLSCHVFPRRSDGVSIPMRRLAFARTAVSRSEHSRARIRHGRNVTRIQRPTPLLGFEPRSEAPQASSLSKLADRGAAAPNGPGLFDDADCTPPRP